MSVTVETDVAGSPDSIPVRLLPISDNGRRRPLKAPDEETRLARVAAWAAFDQLWEEGDGRDDRLTRDEALEWVGRAMGVSSDVAPWSIERFDAGQCERLVTILGPEMNSP